MNDTILTISQAVQEQSKVDGGVIVEDRKLYDAHMPSTFTPAIADAVHEYDNNFAAGTAHATGVMGFNSEEDELSTSFDFGAGTVEHLYQREAKFGDEVKPNYMTSTFMLNMGGTDAAMGKVLAQIAELAVAEEEA